MTISDLPRATVEWALLGIADDYMTSEAHHPGYVLIPVAKFEQLRAAAGVLSGGRAETLKSATADDTPHLQAVEPSSIVEVVRYWWDRRRRELAALSTPIQAAPADDMRMGRRRG